jgi:acyl-homoserine-lactone acylase
MMTPVSVAARMANHNPVAPIAAALLGAVFSPWLGQGAVAAAPAAVRADMRRWQAQAQAVSIVRDDWGIAHIRGATDAEAVFGLIYAQAEDDFNRVETNYITALGRSAEAEGDSAIYSDLRMKLYVDPADLKRRYASSPPWLKRLMNAWADGLNYYLAVHPNVTPRLIRHFEPWMALSFTEGSIGGDIGRVSLSDLEAFYGKRQVAHGAGRSSAQIEADRLRELSGSNGFAIAPSNTRDHHALLLINPHTSFFFRSEAQVTSSEGLNAYGAVTWGQFFIYQGFNERAGWMHTTTGADRVDEFAESIVNRHGRLFYRYGQGLRPVSVSVITVPYRDAAGAMQRRLFTVYRTHHGPIVRQADGKWISVAMMYKPVAALSQSYLRTKARDYDAFIKVAALKANSSNNTIFADADGDIAYLHPQFMPRRDGRFDYRHPVDGADPATDWKGLHRLAELPHLRNPASGWIANTNNWPWSAAGPDSPKAADYPGYMDTAGENPRGIHANLVLKDRHDFTLISLLGAAFDPYLPAFARLIPGLTAAYDQASAADPLKDKLAGQIELLRGWDERWAAQSAATSLAVLWAEQLWADMGAPHMGTGVARIDFMADHSSPQQKLQALAVASDRLLQDFGSWRIPWGDINRFQRLTADIVQKFDDTQPSIPVPFTSSEWGSLAAFDARRYEGTRRYYGTEGNSFVAVVEFGEQVRAMAVSTGGESGDPHSAHFDDQAQRYAAGDLRTVYFYPAQLQGHTERSYHPGQ